MPTYDYQCAGCGHRFEEFQSINAEPLSKCPGCGRKKLQRLIGTGAGVIFKGSGFYQTDYRGSAYAADAQKESAQKESGASGGFTPKCGTSDAPAGCSMSKKD